MRIAKGLATWHSSSNPSDLVACRPTLVSCTAVLAVCLLCWHSTQELQ